MGCSSPRFSLYAGTSHPSVRRMSYFIYTAVVATEKVGPPSDRVLETEVGVDGEISIYNPSTEQVTVLNGTASDVWRLADGEHTLDEIVELLASSYQVSRDEIAQDVTETVRRFSLAGLLQDS